MVLYFMFQRFHNLIFSPLFLLLISIKTIRSLSTTIKPYKSLMVSFVNQTRFPLGSKITEIKNVKGRTTTYK